MGHGRRREHIAVVLLCGCLSTTPVVAQQFPPFPDPPVDRNFNRGGLVDGLWRPLGGEAMPRDIRPELRKARNVTTQPIADPQPRSRKSSGPPLSRVKAAHSY